MAALSSKAQEIQPSRALSTLALSAPDCFWGEGSRAYPASARVAGPSERTPHIRPVQIFPQVHQRKERAQDSGLQIIRQVQAAGGHARQPLAVFGDKTHDFLLPFVRSVSHRRLASHLPAASLDR